MIFLDTDLTKVMEFLLSREKIRLKEMVVAHSQMLDDCSCHTGLTKSANKEKTVSLLEVQNVLADCIGLSKQENRIYPKA